MSVKPHRDRTDERFESLREVLAAARGDQHAATMARRLLRRDGGNVTLLGVARDGRTAFYHFEENERLTELPFDQHGVHGECARAREPGVESVDRALALIRDYCRWVDPGLES